MGHHFNGGYSCKFCGCSIHSFAADDECMGQAGLFAREEEFYDEEAV